MKVQPIPMLSDNYCWWLAADGRDDCLLVDPAEADVALEALEKHGRKLAGILVTHHHPDHVDGIEGILEALGDVPVICSAYDHGKGRVPKANRAVVDDEAFSLAGIDFQVLDVPGHTLGAIAFFSATEKAVFTGDTLFTAGCGRLFEGTPAMMLASLTRLAGLPGDTLVYCGHEYTAKNLKFAAGAEFDNPKIKARLEALPPVGTPTVPSLLSLELATNPFLRTDSKSLQETTNTTDRVLIFTALRGARDQF